jgi:hypothetical protein
VNVIAYHLLHIGAYTVLVTKNYNITCTPAHIYDTTTAIKMDEFWEDIKAEVDACNNYDDSNTITAGKTAGAYTTAAKNTSSTTGNIGTTAQARQAQSTLLYCTYAGL